MIFFPNGRNLARVLIAGISIIFAVPSHATNGYFMIGFGAKSRAMGGAGVAYGQDGLAAAANPASMADVGVGTMRVDVGGEIFNPPRAVSHDSLLLPTDEKSGANLFLIPNMGMIYKFNRKMLIGMSAIGAGLGTRYHQSNPVCDDGDPATNGNNFFNFNCLASPTVGVALYQMQMLPSVAYKLTKQHTVGASLALAVQSFRAYGLQAFDTLGFGNEPGQLTNEGNDWAYGAGIRLGYHGKFFKDRLKLGLNYASRVYMTKFDKYKNLFAEEGGFDIPEHFAVGLALQPTKKLVVTGDVQRIRFSSIRSVGNPGPNPADPNNFFPPGIDVLGTPNGLGFGWKDVTVYKVGLDYLLNNKWNVRAGYNYARSPIPSDQVLFNMLAPATVEKHMTLGASYRPSKNIEWSFNFMHAFENTIKGPTAFGPSAQPVQGSNGAISMKQNSLGVSFAYNL